MSKNLPITHEYYVVFRDGSHWISKFLKKGFGHICLLVKDNYNWVLFEPTMSGFHWEVLPLLTDQLAYDIYFPNCRVIKIRTGQNYKFFLKPALTSCVAAVKYMLGIKCWSQTPYQLYKSLLKKINKKSFNIYYVEQIR